MQFAFLVFYYVFPFLNHILILLVALLAVVAIGAIVGIVSCISGSKKINAENNSAESVGNQQLPRVNHGSIPSLDSDNTSEYFSCEEPDTQSGTFCVPETLDSITIVTGAPELDLRQEHCDMFLGKH